MQKKLLPLTRIIAISLLLMVSISNMYVIGSGREMEKDTIFSDKLIDETSGFPLGWSTELQLSNVSYNNNETLPRYRVSFVKIAAYENYVHTVWEEEQEANLTGVIVNSNVTYCRSRDYGLTWDPPIYLSTLEGGCFPIRAMYGSDPEIALNGSNIHVVWWEQNDDVNQVRYRRSLDNGETWDPIINITGNVGAPVVPKIAVWGNTIHIVWLRKSVEEFYYMNSTDNGNTWSTTKKLTEGIDAPKIAVNGNNIHLTYTRWYDGGSGFTVELFYMNSTDSGITWSPEQLLSPADGLASGSCDMVVAGDNIYIVYDDERDKIVRPEGGGYASYIYFKNSSDGGITWSTDQRLTFNYSMRPSIDIDSDVIHLAWENFSDTPDYYANISYKNSTDGGISWNSDIRLTNNFYWSGGPDIVFNDDKLFVAFGGNKNGGEYELETYFKRYPDFPADTMTPVADAGSYQSVNEDDIVQFDGSSSLDNVGIVWYNWSFGDGNYQNGANATPNHIYTNAGNYIVTLNVSDAAGNWATDTCFVFVSNVAPTANAGSNKTGNEGLAITFDGSASNDTASDLPMFTYVWYFGDGNSEAGKIVNHAYADNDIYNATLVVTDDNGYVDSDTITVTVDNLAPMIEFVSDQTAQQGVPSTLKINATDVPSDVLTFSDNTTLFDINPVTGIIQFTPTNADVGTHFVNVTVTDDDLGSSSITFKITVSNMNDPPVIQPIGSQSATEDSLFTFQVMASDPDTNDPLTYSLTAYPTGMAISSTGLITWTPTNVAVGSHAVTVRVEDAAGLYDEKTFAITVANVNDAPMISTNSLANATEDAMYLYPIQASDVDVGDTLSYSLDSAPSFLSINPSDGMLYGTPANSHVGTHQVIVNVTDGTTYITRAFNLTVINVNDPPTLSYIPTQVATEDISYSLQIVDQDVDVGDTITYSLISSPSGMTINQATGQIVWTPTNDDVGYHTVIVRVSDVNGEFAERSFQITMANVNDEPTIITMALSNATEGTMYLITVQTEDVDRDALTFSFDSSPSFLSINAETGLLYGMPTNNDVGIHQIVVNVSDGTSYVTRAFNLTVLNVNELPTITSYPISVAKLGSEYAYAVIAEDADAGDVLTYSLVEAPEGMTIDGQTGIISWTPTDAQAGQTFQIVVRVSDGNGSTTQTYSIAVDELPAEPYHPLFDDYVWIWIIILLITIIMLLLFYQFNKEKKKEKEPDYIKKED